MGETEEELNPASSVPEVAPGVPAAGGVGPTGFQITEASIPTMARWTTRFKLSIPIK